MRCNGSRRFPLRCKAIRLLETREASRDLSDSRGQSADSVERGNPPPCEVWFPLSLWHRVSSTSACGALDSERPPLGPGTGALADRCAYLTEAQGVGGWLEEPLVILLPQLIENSRQ